MTDYKIQLPDKTIEISSDLLSKYDKTGPRYTSYPTAPEWTNEFSVNSWKQAIEKSNEKGNDVSLYFHIPFCRSACYYCACNFVVSPNPQSSEPYLESLFREINVIGNLVDKNRKVTQLHFGGGTPTFLNCEQLERLFKQIKNNFSLDLSDQPSNDSEISIEIDPRVTSFDQLKLLRKLGFNRVSMGIQDFNPQVQEAVNRVQSYEMVSEMLDYCRELGFQSINFDLIYGLPYQSVESFKETLDKVIKINPDRIALFNYAHLPSLRPFQKAHIDESKLPSRDTKLLIFCEAMKTFCANGYEFIGMDHFAKHDDELCKARKNRTLHRNFQGYTTKSNCDLFGMGMTSISSISNVYSQNEKRLNRYLEFFDDEYETNNLIPIEKGYASTDEDLLRRSVINELLCNGVVLFKEIEEKHQIVFSEHFAGELVDLKELQEDKLIEINNDGVYVTTLGKVFLRNIAMVFDAYFGKTPNKLFSRTV